MRIQFKEAFHMFLLTTFSITVSTPSYHGDHLLAQETSAKATATGIVDACIKVTISCFNLLLMAPSMRCLEGANTMSIPSWD